MTPINHYEGDRPKEEIIYEKLLVATPDCLVQCNFYRRNEIVFYEFVGDPFISPSVVAVFKLKQSKPQ